MVWWDTVSAAKMLFVVSVDAPFTEAQNAYREAARWIESGRYESAAWCDRRVEVYAARGDCFMPQAPVAAWQGWLPDHLAARWIASPDLAMRATQVGPFRLHVPTAMAASQLVLPAGYAERNLRLSDEWRCLFPGGAMVDAVVGRDQLQAVIDAARADAGWARGAARTRFRERLVHVDCPDELPWWDLLATENEDWVLLDVQEQFGISAPDWRTLRDDIAFRAAIGRPMSVLVAFGWLAVMWGQLAAQFMSQEAARKCMVPGCSAGAKLRGRYCEGHAETQRKLKARARKRRQRTRQ